MSTYGYTSPASTDFTGLLPALTSASPTYVIEDTQTAVIYGTTTTKVDGVVSVAGTLVDT